MKGNRRTQADRSAATREALVAAARPLFAEHGFAAVGTETIVRAAGVTRGALYHQFADKAALFEAVFEAVEVEVTGRIDAVVSQSGLDDPIALMRLGAEQWLAACADVEVQRIMLVEAPAVLGWQRWRAIGQRHAVRLIEELLGYAMSVGRIVEQPVEPLAHVLIGALDEAALYVAQATDQQQARAEVTAVIDRLVAGLAR